MQSRENRTNANTSIHSLAQRQIINTHSVHNRAATHFSSMALTATRDANRAHDSLTISTYPLVCGDRHGHGYSCPINDHSIFRWYSFHSRFCCTTNAASAILLSRAKILGVLVDHAEITHRILILHFFLPMRGMTHYIHF